MRAVEEPASVATAMPRAGDVPAAPSALRSAVELAAAAHGVRSCAVVIRQGPDSEPIVVGGVPARAELNGAGSWTAAVLRLRVTDEPVESSSGVWLQRLEVPAYELVAIIVGVDVVDHRRRAATLKTIAGHVTALMTRDLGGTRRSAYEALLHIGAQIQTEQLELDTVLRTIVDKTRELIQTDVSWLALLDEQSGRLRLRVANGARTPEFLGMTVDTGTGIGGVVVEEERTVYVHDHRDYGHGMPEAIHQALDAEGVTSVLCAPMSYHGDIVGALYAGSREPTRFGADSAALLGALAAQAAIAIANARLYVALADRHQELQSAVDVHRALTDASLSGAGLQELVDQLAWILGCGVLLVQDVVAPLQLTSSASDGEAAEMGDGVPVMAGGEQLGALHLLGDARLDPASRRVLERGATIVALELVKQRAAIDVEWRLRGELLEDILQGGGEESSAVVQRAERFGIDLRRPRCLMVLEVVVEGQLEALLDHLRRTVGRRTPTDDLLVGRHGSYAVVAIAAEDHRDAATQAARLQERAARTGIRTRVGISAEGRDIRRAYAQAEAAVRFAGQVSAAALVDYAALGPLRFLLGTPDVGELRLLVLSELAPLAAYDRREGSGQLMETLRAYLDSGGHHRDTAERCHIHANTLKYRLSRISELLDCTLTEPAQRFRLKLAFEVREVLMHAGQDPLA